MLSSPLQLGHGHTIKTWPIRCTCCTWNPQSLAQSNGDSGESFLRGGCRTTDISRLPGQRARGGIQCPGLKVAVQVVVQHGAAAALASSPHPFFAVIDRGCGLGCDPEFLVRVFLACFSSLLSDSMSYSIAFQQISQSWFLLLANENPDFVQLQLVSVNHLQMIFFFSFFSTACLLYASAFLAVLQIIQKRRNEHAENLTTAGK